jgi:hypothetical protein
MLPLTPLGVGDGRGLGGLSCLDRTGEGKALGTARFYPELGAVGRLTVDCLGIEDRVTHGRGSRLSHTHSFLLWQYHQRYCGGTCQTPDRLCPEWALTRGTPEAA